MTDDFQPGVTGVILVGGKSRRMGRDKAFLPWRGGTLFEKVLSMFRENFSTILLVGADEERYGKYGLPCLPDIYPGSALGGLYTGLFHAPHGNIFVSACDMPFPSATLLRYLCSIKNDYHCVVPVTAGGAEPLFAVYAKGALSAMRQLLDGGNYRVYDVYPLLRTRYVTGEELAPFIDGDRSLISVNTPEDFALASKEAGQGETS